MGDPMRERIKLLTRVFWRDEEAEVVAATYDAEPQYDLLIDGHRVVRNVNANEIEPVAI